MVLTAALYGSLIYMCLFWKATVGYSMPILASAGFCLAACIISGRQAIIPLLVGGLIGFFAFGMKTISIPVAIALTIINVMVPYGASLILKYYKFNRHMLAIRDVILLISVAVVIAIISATLGGLAFVFDGIPVTRVSALHHMLGEITGILIVTSMIITWNSSSKVPFTRKNLSSFFVLLIVLTVVSVALFNTDWGPTYLKTWHLFPIMVWLAVSYNIRGISVAMAIVALTASIATIQGTGPFVLLGRDLDMVVFAVQQYLPFTASTMMVLAVVADERRRKYDSEEAANKYRAIIETAVDGIIVIDDNAQIQSLNAAAEKMFGYLPGEAIGKSVDILIPFDQREAHHKAMTHHEKTGERRVLGGPGVTIEALHKEGHTFSAHLAIAEWFVSDKRFYTGIIRDLTLEKQRDGARDMLAREIDHRAKNVLAVVQSLIQLSTGKTKEEFVSNVRGRIESLARAHSLLSQNKWEGASLFTILSEEISSHASRIILRGPPIRLDTDSVQPLSMIIHELLTNAIKYGSLSTEDGGVVIDWHVTKDKNLLLEWQEFAGPKIQEPEHRGFGSRLLDQLSHHQLNGSLVKHWREDGLLACLTIPSKSFKLGPRVESSNEDPSMKLEVLRVQGDKILVVEDNALLAMEMRFILEDAGYQVVGPVSSVAEGLDLANTRNDLDIAVLDINLAGEMSFPIAEALKAKGVPFVFCTGYEHPDTPASLSDCSFMQKPINERSLLSRLAEVRNTI